MLLDKAYWWNCIVWTSGLFLWTTDIWTKIFRTTVFMDYCIYGLLPFNPFLHFLPSLLCTGILTDFEIDLECMASCFFNNLCWNCMNFDKFWNKLWCELVRLPPPLILHILGEKVLVQKYSSSENRCLMSVVQKK